MLLLGLALPATGAARLASRSWAKGSIIHVSSSNIAVRGTVVLTLANGAGATTKFTLGGIRRLTCSVNRATVVRGYRVGNTVSITCDGGVLSHIARAG
jgi:hypothetical protein